eukprot:1140817-Pelagomonas_calceolata.AAC.3
MMDSQIFLLPSPLKPLVLMTPKENVQALPPLKIASGILLRGISKGPLGQALPPWTLAAQIVLLYKACRFLNTQQIEPSLGVFSLAVSLTNKGSLLVSLMQ